jgi:hypothetical protein
MGTNGQLHPLTLYSPPEERTAGNPLYRRNSGPQSQSGCYGEEKNLFPLSKIEPDFSVLQT